MAGAESVRPFHPLVPLCLSEWDGSRRVGVSCIGVLLRPVITQSHGLPNTSSRSTISSLVTGFDGHASQNNFSVPVTKPTQFPSGLLDSLQVLNRVSRAMSVS